jgi:outer membrane receptor protein involved in Fe transport
MRALVLCAAAFAHATPAYAQPIFTSTTTEEIIIRGQLPTTVGSASIVRARDLMLRPRRRPADILEVTPGLEVIQHSGGGKANQYFIRGFDADHGTDLALSVDGVPVNLVSHGHGQGYADLHFVIPELVDRIEVKKGPYFAELGDFATAGAVDLVLKEKLTANSITLGGGSFDSYRGLAIGGATLGPIDALFAGEVYTTDGPFQSQENLQRFNALGRAKTELLDGDLTLTLTGYGSRWSASGQIPNREVRAGRLDRYGSVDDTEGGSSHRFNAYAKWERLGSDDELAIAAYVTRYRLQLFSNFTFFSRDPVNGDMIEQIDDRILAGASARYRFDAEVGPIELGTTFGLQTRSDFIDNGLYHDAARRRLETVVESDIRETSLSLYAEEELRFTDWLRAVIGLRGDWFHFSVGGAGNENALIASPKASVVVTPFEQTDLFVNFGMGFHSNDARGVVDPNDPVTPLTRALGGELGARTRLFDRLDLGASVFLLDLDSEIVFVGDEGTTEASGATRRLGLEAEARVELFSWLWADADFTLTRARFVGAAPGEAEIPLAPRLSVSGGISAVHPLGIYGRIGLLHLTDRPATEDGFITAEGFTKADLTLGYKNELFEVALDVENLLDADLREAQFATVSRLPHETSAASCPDGTRPISDGAEFTGCEDLHFTPGPPLSARVSFSLFF